MVNHLTYRILYAKGAIKECHASKETLQTSPSTSETKTKTFKGVQNTTTKQLSYPASQLLR